MTVNEYVALIETYKARLARRLGATNVGFRQQMKRMDKWNREISKLRKDK